MRLRTPYHERFMCFDSWMEVAVTHESMQSRGVVTSGHKLSHWPTLSPPWATDIARPHQHPTTLHAPLMTCLAFACLQCLRLAGQRPTGLGKIAASRSGTATIAEPACHTPRHRRAPVRTPRRAAPVPALQTQTQATT